jgi:serine/threonine-protein kinase RsbW
MPRKQAQGRAARTGTAAAAVEDGDPPTTVSAAGAQLDLKRKVDELAQALRDRERAEEAHRNIVVELRGALESLRQLSAILPFCSSCEFNMVIPADPALIQTVTGGIGQALRNTRGAAGHEFEIELALQEALANAVRHGSHGDPTKSIQCRVTYDAGNEVLIVVRDPGAGFDVSTVPNPLDDTNVLRDHGRGIFLINHLMDAVHFVDGGRELHMRKVLTPDVRQR